MGLQGMTFPCQLSRAILQLLDTLLSVPRLQDNPLIEEDLTQARGERWLNSAPSEFLVDLRIVRLTLLYLRCGPGPVPPLLNLCMA
jgi:hypothetical protein